MESGRWDDHCSDGVTTDLGDGLSGTVVLEEKCPVGRHERAAEWLRVWADLERAPRTIDAYARGLAEFLQVCDDHGIDPVTAAFPQSRCRRQ